MAMLEVKNIGISFGGLKAVDNFSLTLEENELSGLIGPNGAGKTTIFNLLTGVYRPDKGSIRLDGKELTGKSIIEINQAGIARTLQFADTRAKNLPYGSQRKLEIARALATEPKLLLLDEPAAGMNPNETAELMETIQLVQKRFRMTILLIEHDMKLVSGICERLTVLNFGKVLKQGETQEVLHDPEVVKAYLGE